METMAKSKNKSKISKPHPMPRKAGISPSRGYKNGGKLKKKSV